MRFAVLVLALTTCAAAQTQLAEGSGAYLSVGNLDVVGSQTWVDLAAGWRWAQGADLGVIVEHNRYPDGGGRSTDRRLGVEAGKTWTVSPRIGLRVSGSASLDRLSFDNVTVYTRRGSYVPGVPSTFDERQATATFGGTSADIEAFAFAHVGLAGSVGVQPGLGVFVHHESLTSDDADASLFALGPVREGRDAAGVRLALPVTARVLGTDLALSPVIRVGVGIEDHAAWVDGGMRLHVNL